jgi:hypothetical protein
MKARSAPLNLLSPPTIPWLMLLIVTAFGCGKGSEIRSLPSPKPRQSVIWLGAEGINSEAARYLKRAGVDQFMLQLGSVRLSSSVPVPMLVPMPPLAGGFATGIALRVEQAHPEIDPSHARVLWQALESLPGDLSEIALIIPEVRGGLEGFVARLAEESGLPVMPVLTTDQLTNPQAIELVRAANGCVVVAFGNPAMFHADATLSDDSLSQQLAPIRELGVRVRVGVVLAPHTIPSLDSGAEDLNHLTENDLTEIETTAGLDWIFTFRESATWSGRSWNAGDRIAMRWIDASRLDASLSEMNRLSLPELGGWDLIPMPPESPSYLGMSREILWRYLSGDGPAPQLEASVERVGASFRIFLKNPGPFASSVSSFENYLEVTVTGGGYLMSEDPGSFDQVLRGNRSGDQWEIARFGNVSSLRYVEKYIGPYEVLETDWMRAVSARAEVMVRWHIVLSSGDEVSSPEVSYEELS